MCDMVPRIAVSNALLQGVRPHVQYEIPSQVQHQKLSRAILKELGFSVNVHSRPLDPFNKKLCIYIYALYLFIYCGHR